MLEKHALFYEQVTYVKVSLFASFTVLLLVSGDRHMSLTSPSLTHPPIQTSGNTDFAQIAVQEDQPRPLSFVVSPTRSTRAFFGNPVVWRTISLVVILLGGSFLEP
jgi:hypothetical protein